MTYTVLYRIGSPERFTWHKLAGISLTAKDAENVAAKLAVRWGFAFAAPLDSALPTTFAPTLNIAEAA